METRFHKAWSVAALGALLAVSPALCDDSYTMAPPIQIGSVQNDGTPGDISADSVFNWSEVPQDQQVPIRRAVFDRGGYQLYDTAGETIVVPFTHQNLYVMKFGQSTDGSTYFVNEGNAPTLYVPRDGYLENASAPGSRWYPFSEEFRPSRPVFLGCAPSWTSFCGMGWYPDMYCHGGYYCREPFVRVGFVQPTFGLFFEIGGHHYDGWDHYHDYYRYHPAPYHVTVVNNYYYQRAGHPEWGGRPFGGGDRSGGNHFNTTHSFGQGRVYGGGRSFGGRSDNDDHGYLAHRNFTGGVHTFQGGRAVGEDRTFSSRQPALGGGRAFEGTRPSPADGGNRAFNGNRTFREGQTTSSDHAFGGSRPSFGGGHSDSRTAESHTSNQRESRPSGSGENRAGSERSGGRFNGIGSGSRQR